MTRKQRQRMAAPNRTAEARRLLRVDNLLRQLEREGFEVTRMGGWKCFIQPKVGAA